MRSTNKLINKAYEIGELAGYTVSIHPSGTAVIKNFREVLILHPQEDGSVVYETREPLCPVEKRGQVYFYAAIQDLLEGLR